MTVAASAEAPQPVEIAYPTLPPKAMYQAMESSLGNATTLYEWWYIERAQTWPDARVDEEVKHLFALGALCSSSSVIPPDMHELAANNASDFLHFTTTASGALGLHADNLLGQALELAPEAVWTYFTSALQEYTAAVIWPDLHSIPTFKRNMWQDHSYPYEILALLRWLHTIAPASPAHADIVQRTTCTMQRYEDYRSKRDFALAYEELLQPIAHAGVEFNTLEEEN